MDQAKDDAQDAPEVEADKADPATADAKSDFDDLKRRAAGLESTVGAHIEEAERVAEARAREIVAEAERQAEVIRADADRQATGVRAEAEHDAKGAREEADREAEATREEADRVSQGVRDEALALVERSREQVNELVDLRKSLFASLRETLGDFEDAIARAEENHSFAEAEDLVPTKSEDPGAPAEDAPAEEISADAEDASDEQQQGAPAAPTPVVLPPTPGPTAPTAAAGIVLVRVEPVRDLQVARGIERAFGSLPMVRKVSLRSFEGRTALLETSGLDVNALLGSMRRHLPLPFILRDAGPGQLVVQVGEVPGVGGA